MERKLAKERLLKNCLRYLLYFLAFAVTPWVGKGLSPIFDAVGYSQMRVFFAELLTIIFWVVELCAIFFHEKKKRLAQQSQGAEEDKTEGGEKIAEKQEEKQDSPLLPMKNILSLLALVGTCILVVSAQIGFAVKPFYEITGTGYEMLGSIAGIGADAVKCIWIVWILRIARVIARDLALFKETEEASKGRYWLAYIALVMAFGLYDILTSGMQLSLCATYLLLFYPSFIGVDELTQRHGIKSYFVILLIYLF